MTKTPNHYSPTDSLAYKRRRYTAQLHPEVVADLFHYVEAGVIDVNLASLIADVLGPGDWRNEAACRGSDVTMFFPEKVGGPGRAAAAKICATCPVRADCYAYANEAPEMHGIWAGASVATRRRTPGSGTSAPSQFDKPKTVCVDCFCELDGPNMVRCDVCRRRTRSEANSRYYDKTAGRYGWRHLDARYPSVAS